MALVEMQGGAEAWIEMKGDVPAWIEIRRTHRLR